MSKRRDRDALRRRLDALGESPANAADPARIDATEARLRAIYDANGGRAPDVRSATGTRGSSRRKALLGSAGAAGVAMVALASFALLRDEPSSMRADLELTAAEHAYIELANGQRIAAEAGAIVPEGARIVVGENGSITIGDVTLGPGESAIVSDGELTIDAPGAGSTTDASGIPGTTDPATATTRPNNATTSTQPTTTTAPATSTTRPTTTTTTPPTTTTRPPREVVRLRASARVVETRVRLDWQTYPAPNFRAYLVLVRTDGQPPTLGTPGTAVVFRTTDPAVHLARVPFRPGMTIRIVAIGTNDTVLASSTVLRPALAPKSEPPTTTTLPATTTPATTTTATPPMP
jgi:hypothetical protein